MAATNTSESKIAAKLIFTVRNGVWSVDVLDTGRLAVAGPSKENNSFIALLMFDFDTVSPEKPSSLTSEHNFSAELTKFGSQWRCVSILDDRLFLTCCEDWIALYDSSSNGVPVKQGNFIGKPSCMTTRDGRVYIGLYDSTEVIVFDARELGEHHTIVLKDLSVKERPADITVSSNKLFICTGFGYKRALMYNMEGRKEHVYKAKLAFAESITVSEEKELTFILSGMSATRHVVVYSLSGGHSSISGGHYSISEDHILAFFKVPDYSWRIRINKDLNRLFLVTSYGEVFEHHKSDIFTFDNLLIHSKSLIEKDDCQKLLDYLKVPAKESKDIIKSDAPFTTLIHHLREAGTVSVDAFSHLMTACSDKGLSKLVAALTVYQQAQVTQNVFKDQLKALENKRQELSDELAESENEKQQLRDELKTLKEEKAALLQQQQQASSASVTEGETLPEELETLDVSQHSTLAD